MNKIARYWKIVFLILCLLLVVIIAHKFSEISEKAQLESQNSTLDTVNQINEDSPSPIQTEDEIDQEPSSQNEVKPSISSPGDQQQMLKNRPIVGLPNGADISKIQIINEINENNKELFKISLLNTLPEESQVTITPQRSLVLFENGFGRYVEEIKVEIINEKLGKSAYRGFIDSQTGMLLKTWDRTTFDANPYVKKFRFKE